MDWFSDIFRDYLHERFEFQRKEMLNIGCWVKRFRRKSRAQEVSRLLNEESKFNERWSQQIKEAIAGLDDTKNAVESALRLIETHTKKENGRSYFLIILAALLALIFKFFGGDLILALIIGSFFIAYERLIVDETIKSLEELKVLIEAHKPSD